MSSSIFASATALLEDLGITAPDEIDITAIAQHCNATILYKPLEGCAARITGNGDQAIITIDSSSRPERQRFSAGHELGHWMFDRGKVSMFSCEEHLFVKEWSKNNPETRANRYASDLLMPLFMFKPRAKLQKRIDFTAVKSLAKDFTTSLTATAIRLVEHGPLPSMLVCSSGNGVEWFVRSSGTKRLWPTVPGRDTYGFDVLSGAESEAAGDVPASAWFDHKIAERYQIYEHSVRAYNDLVLSLLWWPNERMLIELDDYEEERDSRPSWHRN